MNNDAPELDLIKKIIIVLIVINFISIIFYSFTGNTLNVSNPNNSALQTLANMQGSISRNANILTASFSAQVIAPAIQINIVNAIPTIGVWIINFIYKTGIFLVSLSVIVGLSFATVFVMVFGVIPQLFINGNFGVFNYIATAIYGVMVLFIGIYGLYILGTIKKRWF